MKKFFLILSALLILGSHTIHAKAPWVTNFEKAQEKAKTENKHILLNFTGSDWCGWCIKLHDEVFSKKTFKDYADQNLILVEVDFPQDKEISSKVKKQNKTLKEKFNIRGYPTIIILDSDGNEVGKLGYMEGGPSAFISALDKIIKK